MAKKKQPSDPQPDAQPPLPKADLPSDSSVPDEQPAPKKTRKRSRNVSPLLESTETSDTEEGTNRTNMPLLMKRAVVDAVIGQMNQTKPDDLVDGVLSLRLQTMLRKLLQNEKSRAYYYRLAFSVAYRSFELHRQREFIANEHIDVQTYRGKLPKLKFPVFADMIGVSRYNIPRLFVGKGQNEFLLSAIHNLRFQHISLEAILHTPNIIEKAYIHYTLLESGVSLDEHQDSDDSLLI